MKNSIYQLEQIFVDLVVGKIILKLFLDNLKDQKQDIYILLKENIFHILLKQKIYGNGHQEILKIELHGISLQSKDRKILSISKIHGIVILIMLYVIAGFLLVVVMYSYTHHIKIEFHGNYLMLERINFTLRIYGIVNKQNQIVDADNGFINQEQIWLYTQLRKLLLNSITILKQISK